MSYFISMENKLFKHYKGNIYQVIGVAQHTETGEPLVIYYPVEPLPIKKYWARPLSMWNETVSGQPRFKLLQDSSKSHDQ